MRYALIFIAFGPLTACVPDETISGYAGTDATYHLTQIDGSAFAATAMIAFPQEGEVTGQGPCNGFSARQTVPYPWFDITDLRATRRACPDLPAETAFFAALSDMTLAEAANGTLILSNSAGRQMVFEAR